MLIIAQVLKEKWGQNHGFCSFKMNVNEAVNDSARVSEQSRNQSDCRIWMIPPARKLGKK